MEVAEEGFEVSPLEALRVDRGLTITQVVDATGLAHKTVRKMELGQALAPTGDKLKKLAELYDTRPSELLRLIRVYRRDRDRARETSIAA
jgi:transcriptional regulator with XRE-family HTH domain